METKIVKRDKWQSYFDMLTKSLEGKRVTIDVGALKTGEQVEAEDLVLLGITYDPRDDLIEVSMEDLDHMIRSPRNVQIAFGDKGVEAIQITNKDGGQQIVHLKDPLLLPAPK